MINIDFDISEKYAPIFVPFCQNCGELTNQCTCGEEWDSTKARYYHLYGGRGRGGSHTVTEIALQKLLSPAYFRGYFMREIFGDIRGSLWKDLMDRIEEKEIPKHLFHINESTMYIKCLKTGNEIFSKGFKKSSGKSTAKLKSIAGATDVFVEEAEEVSRDDFRKLDDSLRTSKSDGVHIWCLFNMQNKDHWLHRDWYDLTPVNYNDYANIVPLEFKKIAEDFFLATPKKRDDFVAIFSDYKDNLSNLDKSTIRNFKQYAKDEKTIEHFLSDVVGLVSSGAKGRVFRNWKIYNELPELEYYELYVMDFGYDPDPTVLRKLHIHKKTKSVYIKEIFREKELSTPDIFKRCKAAGIGKSFIICDNAEKREIAELKKYGLNVTKSKKGAGSIVSGIKVMKGWNIYLHSGDTESKKEYENYVWEMNKDGEPTGKPIDNWNHGIDGDRYGLTWYTERYMFKAS